MNIFLIRHGQGRHQSEGLIGGWTDVELTEKGRRQAHAVGLRLKDVVQGEVQMVSSDIHRAVETATIISEVTGIEFSTDPLLREIGQGVVEGQPRAEAMSNRAPVSDPVLDWRPYPEAETWREFDRRIVKFVDKLHDFSTRNLIVVSHFQTTVSIIHNILDLTDDQKTLTDFRIDNCSLSIVEYEPTGHRFLRTINDISHLIGINGRDHRTSDSVQLQ